MNEKRDRDQQDGEEWIAGYSGFLIFGGIIGLVAVGIGVSGIYMAVTTSPGEGSPPEPLEQFVCEEEIEIDGEYVTPYEVDSVDRTGTGVTDAGFSDNGTFSARTRSSVLNVSATGSDGKQLGTDETDGRVEVTPSQRSFRLWIDTVNERGEVVRYVFDICLPEG